MDYCRICLLSQHAMGGTLGMYVIGQSAVCGFLHCGNRVHYFFISWVVSLKIYNKVSPSLFRLSHPPDSLLHIPVVLLDKSVSLYKKMSPAPTKEKPFVFYDSNCGIPLFKGVCPQKFIPLFVGMDTCQSHVGTATVLFSPMSAHTYLLCLLASHY